jgi:hypothetical protein
MHIFFLLTALFVLSPVGTAAILNSVEITGNKRTKREAIIQHGQINIGSELSDLELQKIKESLGRIGQIHVKNIEFKNNILKIEVVDKWTIFPVPTITQSGNYHNRGFLIYDDNFLGTLGTFAPGISWSNSVFNYLLYFQNESLFSQSYGIKLFLMKKSEQVEFSRSNNAIDIHESRYNSYLIAPNYLYKDHVFKAGPIYIDKSIFNNNLRISRDKSKGIFFRHHWNAYQNLEIMYEGFVTTFDLYALKSQNGKMIYLNEANVNWSLPHKDNFINFGIHGYHSNEETYIYAKNLGGDEGYRGYDKASLPASQNLGGLFQYQYHLFHRFFLAPFYEYNSSWLIKPILNGKRLDENTLGAGIHYYFKKISIPAVQFDAGRNMNDKSNHFHINIGVSI